MILDPVDVFFQQKQNQQQQLQQVTLSDISSKTTSLKILKNVKITLILS